VLLLRGGLKPLSLDLREVAGAALALLFSTVILSVSWGLATVCLLLSLNAAVSGTLVVVTRCLARVLNVLALFLALRLSLGVDDIPLALLTA